MIDVSCRELFLPFGVKTWKLRPSKVARVRLIICLVVGGLECGLGDLSQAVVTSLSAGGPVACARVSEKFRGRNSDDGGI